MQQYIRLTEKEDAIVSYVVFGNGSVGIAVGHFEGAPSLLLVNHSNPTGFIGQYQKEDMPVIKAEDIHTILTFTNGKSIDVMIQALQNLKTRYEELDNHVQTGHTH
jgi:hypothetical protein